jgi:hypothetical protein
MTEHLTATQVQSRSSVGDSFNWLSKIVLSCTDTFQFDCVDVLISLFDAKYNDEHLTTELKKLRREKFFKVHNILA